MVSGSSVADSDEWQQIIVPSIQDPDTHLCVDAIDRIIRADSFDFRVFETLQSTDTKIYAPGKIHDLGNPDDAFLAGLLALLGGKEKREIKRRWMDAKEAKRRAGCWVNRLDATPFGTEYNRTAQKWHHSPDADTVRQIYNMVVDNVPIRQVATITGKTPAGIRQIVTRHYLQRYSQIRSKTGRNQSDQTGGKATRTFQNSPFEK